MPKGKPKIPIMQRFWERVQKTDSCWSWLGVTDRYGYGQIRSGDDCRKLLKALMNMQKRKSPRDWLSTIFVAIPIASTRFIWKLLRIEKICFVPRFAREKFANMAIFTQRKTQLLTDTDGENAENVSVKNLENEAAFAGLQKRLPDFRDARHFDHWSDRGDMDMTNVLRGRSQD